MMQQTITCQEWEPIGMGNLDQAALFRHFMFLGESGSGKTASGIMPLCRVAFSPESKFKGLLAAGLVVDPKNELGGYLEQLMGEEAPQRLLRLRPGAEGPVLWQFEHQPIDNLGAIGILEQMMSSADAFQRQSQSVADHSFWFDTAKQFLQALIDIDCTLWRHPNGLQEKNIEQFWCCLAGLLQLIGMPADGPSDDKPASKPDQQKAQEATKADGTNPRMKFSYAMSSIPSAVDNANDASPRLKAITLLRSRCCDEELRDLVESCLQSGRIQPLLQYRRENYLNHVTSLLALSMSGVWGKGGGAAETVLRHLKITCGEQAFNQFWALFIAFCSSWKINGTAVFTPLQTTFFSQYLGMSDGTYSSVHAVVSSLISEQVTPEFCSRISLNPFVPPDTMLRTKDVIEQGMVVVYEPGRVSSVAVCIGKMLKAGFFKALLDVKRLNAPDARPFFYICDEFQQFVTFDEESGEQSFLDRCRAYRVCCGLATQSIASLRYMVSSHAGEHAVRIMLVNTGTKLFFRTTDSETSDSLYTLIPAPTRSGKMHVVRVRPLTTLQAGECYYLLVNGKTGRGRVAVQRPNEQQCLQNNTTQGGCDVRTVA